MKKCECEQATCHGDKSCPDPGTQYVLTVFGPYRMCDHCCHTLPGEYHKDACTCMYCEGA